MTSLSFPDVNVWLALAATEHVHHRPARRWWEREIGRIAFARITQLSFLRLMTTAAAMGGKPLTTAEAFGVYSRLFEDDLRRLRLWASFQRPLGGHLSYCQESSPKWIDRRRWLGGKLLVARSGLECFPGCALRSDRRKHLAPRPLLLTRLRERPEVQCSEVNLFENNCALSPLCYVRLADRSLWPSRYPR
jgi:hypothetical protein